MFPLLFTLYKIIRIIVTEETNKKKVIFLEFQNFYYKSYICQKENKRNSFFILFFFNIFSVLHKFKKVKSNSIVL